MSQLREVSLLSVFEEVMPVAACGQEKMLLSYGSLRATIGTRPTYTSMCEPLRLKGVGLTFQLAFIESRVNDDIDITFFSSAVCLPQILFLLRICLLSLILWHYIFALRLEWLCPILKGFYSWIDSVLPAVKFIFSLQSSMLQNKVYMKIFRSIYVVRKLSENVDNNLY